MGKYRLVLLGPAVVAMMGTVTAVCLLAQGGSVWRTYKGAYFSFNYPGNWKITVEDEGKSVKAKDPTDPDHRYLLVGFEDGATNEPSVALQCQTLNDRLMELGNNWKKAAGDANEKNGTTDGFWKLDVTFEFPHASYGSLGGELIRISIVQNRGGFDEVQAWDYWVNALARSDGFYYVGQYNPRPDPHPHEMWQQFIKSVKFGDKSKATGSGICR